MLPKHGRADGGKPDNFSSVCACVCARARVRVRVCVTHVVGQCVVVSRPAPEGLRGLFQNLVVLLGEQSKQATRREDQRKDEG